MFYFYFFIGYFSIWILLIFRFEKSVNIFFGYSNFGFMLRKAKAVFTNFNFFSLFYDSILKESSFHSAGMYWTHQLR